MSQEAAQFEGIWIFQGYTFNEGVLSALRAYPEVIALRRVIHMNGEYLLLKLEPARDEVTLLASAVVRAGGHIDCIHRASGSLEDAAMSLTHDNTNKNLYSSEDTP